MDVAVFVGQDLVNLLAREDQKVWRKGAVLQIGEVGDRDVVSARKPEAGCFNDRSLEFVPELVRFDLKHHSILASSTRTASVACRRRDPSFDDLGPSAVPLPPFDVSANSYASAARSRAERERKLRPRVSLLPLRLSPDGLRAARALRRSRSSRRLGPSRRSHAGSCGARAASRPTRRAPADQRQCKQRWFGHAPTPTGRLQLVVAEEQERAQSHPKDVGHDHQKLIATTSAAAAMTPTIRPASTARWVSRRLLGIGPFSSRDHRGDERPGGVPGASPLSDSRLHAHLAARNPAVTVCPKLSGRLVISR